MNVRNTIVEGPDPPKHKKKGPYTFVSSPRALYNNMKLFKRPPCGGKDMPYNNIMYDRRVVRGSTYAQHPLNFGDGESAAARAAETRRRNQQRRRERQLQRPTSPPAVPGRRHEPIQTDAYLEELFDKGEEMTTGTQTDLFLDRPATPIYVPAKTGCDASTQIGAGDLFDFDLEVQPILEVLVGKTCEQALMECLEEEELEALREQQRRFRELRDSETAEKRRLVEQDRRLEEEKERRIESGKDAEAAHRATAERVAAAALVQGYIADLLPGVLDGLKEQGYLFERTKRCVDETFLPWLMVEVTQEIESMITSRDILTEIVREVIEQRVDRYRCAGELEAMLQDTRVSSSSGSEAEENLEG